MEFHIYPFGIQKKKMLKKKITRDTLVHETLNQYLKWKPPIDSFSEDGLASLPSDKRDILLANIDQIFHEDNTFQKQIKTVVSLIYDPSKSHLVHQIQVLDLGIF